MRRGSRPMHSKRSLVMRTTTGFTFSLLVLGAPGCLSAHTRTELDQVSSAAERDRIVRMRQPVNLQTEEAALARETRPEVVLRIALSRNPDLQEARERVRAGLHRARAAGRLP